MICRLCNQENVHYCPGGKLQAGDRAFDLYGETRAFPGLADAADCPLTSVQYRASITDTGNPPAEEQKKLHGTVR